MRLSFIFGESVVGDDHRKTEPRDEMDCEGDKAWAYPLNVEFGETEVILRFGFGFEGSARLHLETRLLNDDVVRFESCGDCEE